MGLNPGTLRHRVTLEYPAVTENAYGEEVVVWRTLGKRYARVSPQSGDERWAAQSVDAVISHEVEMRWMEDIRADLRVIHRGRVLHVEAVMDPDERRERLLLACREILDAEPN